MENYRPKYIEFDFAHDNSDMPHSFGSFENAEEAAKFIGSNFVSINQSMTVIRHLDNFEKNEIRKQYSDVLENELPTKEKDLARANIELAQAKKELQIAIENVNAALNKVKALAIEVKHGVTDIKLDELYTYRIAYKSKYYFYTYIDAELRLCAIRDIPESEKGEIWNQLAGNEEFIDNHFGTKSVDEQYLNDEISIAKYAEKITGEKLSEDLKGLLDGKTETQEGTQE